MNCKYSITYPRNPILRNYQGSYISTGDSFSRQKARLCVPNKGALVLAYTFLGFHVIRSIPRPSIYPLLDPKYLLLGTIYPYLRVQGGSW